MSLLQAFEDAENPGSSAALLGGDLPAGVEKPPAASGGVRWGDVAPPSASEVG